jgi:hypothetical protein
MPTLGNGGGDGPEQTLTSRGARLQIPKNHAPPAAPRLAPAPAPPASSHKGPAPWRALPRCWPSWPRRFSARRSWLSRLRCRPCRPPPPTSPLLLRFGPTPRPRSSFLRPPPRPTTPATSSSHWAMPRSDSSRWTTATAWSRRRLQTSCLLSTAAPPLRSTPSSWRTGPWPSTQGTARATPRPPCGSTTRRRAGGRASRSPPAAAAGRLPALASKAPPSSAGARTTSIHGAPGPARMASTSSLRRRPVLEGRWQRRRRPIPLVACVRTQTIPGSTTG